MNNEEPTQPKPPNPEENKIEEIINNENLSDEQFEDAIFQYLRKMNPKTPEEYTLFSIINTV